MVSIRNYKKLNPDGSQIRYIMGEQYYHDRLIIRTRDGIKFDK